ncbi:hypothetical protein DOY81_013028, partial [Sarcophaga bullata]
SYYKNVMNKRIEQQTEIMNARSERLKMMKLQYEMYFAKLVHSQTRRCIQNSVAPVVPMMNAASVQPLAQNATPSVQQPTMEGYNYLPNANTPMMPPFQYYAAAPNYEKEQYGRQQYFNMPSKEAMEMPQISPNIIEVMKWIKNELRYEKIEINTTTLYPMTNIIKTIWILVISRDMANNPTRTVVCFAFVYQQTKNQQTFKIQKN